MKLAEPLKFDDEWVEVTEAGTLRRRYKVWGDYDREVAAWKAVAAPVPARTFRLGCIFLKDAEITCPDVPGADGRPFTVPKRLRVFFRFDRALLGELARLAWETVREVYRATLGRNDLLPGALAGIQTFGELIHWHPHIHALVTDGAFDADGVFHPLPAVAVEPFRELFAHKLLNLLLDRGKITAEVVENIRSWKHSGFSADKSVRIEAGDRAGLERLRANR